MPTATPLLDVLARWNLWGSARLDPGLPRAVTDRLQPFVDTAEVVALIGPRRAGKSTVLFQLMAARLAAGVEPQGILHLNLEEPALAPELGLPLLDRLYDLYRAEVFPRGRAYLFLDEVQRLAGWERWVRARAETEDVKIFVTGSSAALMSRELATLLTGRHLTFKVLPLDFREFLAFRGIEPPAEPRLAGSPPVLRHALLDYLRWGGFPEVVLAADERRKEALLKQYFEDVLFKDLALRHQIRDLPTLRSLAVHLLSQTASLVSLQRVASIFGVSLDLARAYCSFLEEAFLVTFLPFYSLKTAERLRRPRKVHAVDTGLRNAVSLTGSPDRGRLAETAVADALAREEDAELYYWQGKGEVDLVLRRGTAVRALVQVAYEGMDQAEVRHRELEALAEARGRFPKAEAILIRGEPAAFAEEPEAAGVKLVPLWRALLGER
jgi:predicted AAA+ superfamily ATPase